MSTVPFYLWVKMGLLKKMKKRKRLGYMVGCQIVPIFGKAEGVNRIYMKSRTIYKKSTTFKIQH